MLEQGFYSTGCQKIVPQIRGVFRIWGTIFPCCYLDLLYFLCREAAFGKKLEPPDRLGATDSERDESYRNFLRSFDLLIETYCLVPFMSSVLKGKAVSTFWPLAGSP